MQLQFEKAETKDAQTLAKICERAFHSLDDKIVGGIFFGPVAYQHYELMRIFVDPAYQRQGIGVQAMAFMESLHPEVKRWTLGTPQWNTRTPRFYERCGYVQVGRDSHGDYLYEKRT